MLSVKTTENLAGVTVSGTYWDLNALYDALTTVIGEEESYPEFEPYAGTCFFQPCYHATEPRCAVRQAVAEGKIDPLRHERYVALLEEIKIRWRERYD